MSKEEALRIYVEQGPQPAAEYAGVTTRTITNWAKAAGVTSQEAVEKTSAARAENARRVSQAWGDYRAQEAVEAGAAAGHARRHLLDALDARDHHLIRAIAIAYGIMIDKAEKLSGQAAERIEVWAESEVDRELRRLVDELEDRVREPGG